MSNRLETLPDSATLPITVRLPVSDVRRLAALTAATPYATRNKLVCAAITHGLTVLEEITPPAPAPARRRGRK